MKRSYKHAVDRIGDVFQTTNHGKGEIIGLCDRKDKYRQPYFLFEFHRTGTVVEVTLPRIKSGTVKDPSVKTLAEKRIGEVFHSANSGSGEIVAVSDKRDKSGNVRFIFKFYNSGNEVDISYRNLTLGNFKDYAQTSVLGVGYSYPGASKSPFYKTWSHMLERCYNTKFKAYPRYGGRGVKVCDEWLTFSNFEKDCMELNGVNDFLRSPKQYSLDKDRKGNGMLYSKDTCEFSSFKRQGTFTSKEFNVVAKRIECGTEILFYSVNECAKSLGTHDANIHKVLKGERKSAGGYTFRRLEDSFLKPKLKEEIAIF